MEKGEKHDRNPHTTWLYPPSRHVLTPVGRYILGQGTGHTTLHGPLCGSTFVHSINLQSLLTGFPSQFSTTMVHFLMVTSVIFLESLDIRMLLLLLLGCMVSAKVLLLLTCNGLQVHSYTCPGQNRVHQMHSTQLRGTFGRNHSTLSH